MKAESDALPVMRRITVCGDVWCLYALLDLNLSVDQGSTRRWCFEQELSVNAKMRFRRKTS